MKASKLEIELGLVTKNEPVNHSDEEWVEIIRENCWAIYDVPKDKQTEEMVIEAVTPRDRLIELADGTTHVNRNACMSLGNKCISRRLYTPRVLLEAVKRNPTNLCRVPHKKLTDEMIHAALSQSGYGYMIWCVPSERHTDQIVEEAILNDTESFESDGVLRYVDVDSVSEELLMQAVVLNRKNVKYVPANIKTKKFYKELISRGGSLEAVPKSERTKSLCSLAFSTRPDNFAFIPDNLKTNAMCEKAVAIHPGNLRYVPSRAKAKDMVENAVLKDPEMLEFAGKWKSKQICVSAVSHSGNLIEYVPKRLIDSDLVRLAMETCSRIDLYLPDELHYLIDRPEESTSIGLTKDDVDDTLAQLVPVHSAYEEAILGTSKSIVQREIPESSSAVTTWYVSDLHLEFQLKDLVDSGMSSEEILLTMKESVEDMLLDTPWPEGTNIILVAGDVSHSLSLTKHFYGALSKWMSTVVGVLGNHELWMGDVDGTKNHQPLDTVVDEYKKELDEIHLLDNELLLLYKNQRRVVLSEETILRASAADLADLCDKATWMILGGVGYSGLNHSFNSKDGIYRGAIANRKEEVDASKRFCRVYRKIEKSCHDKQVIVLTHMPYVDWLPGDPNPNWIYVSGHTHRNYASGTRKPVILADNQIGYEKKKLRLKRYCLGEAIYDPFASFNDGAYRVEEQDYLDFLRGRSIQCQGCSWAGQIWMLKRGITYMFLLENDGRLYLLNGGTRKKLPNNSIDYYLNNLNRYAKIINNAFQPYRRAQRAISKEIRRFGGSGTVHGCIIDIDWFNHIYLNPFDGIVTAYWAADMTDKKVYRSVKALLSSECPELLESYTDEVHKGSVSILSGKEVSGGQELAVVPEPLLDKSMYEPSRIMRSIQYLLDNGVVRVWNEDVLNNPTAMSGQFNGRGRSKGLPKPK